jgi:hypothetical protein
MNKQLAVASRLGTSQLSKSPSWQLGFLGPAGSGSFPCPTASLSDVCCAGKSSVHGEGGKDPLHKPHTLLRHESIQHCPPRARLSLLLSSFRSQTATPISRSFVPPSFSPPDFRGSLALHLPDLVGYINRSSPTFPRIHCGLTIIARHVLKSGFQISACRRLSHRVPRSAVPTVRRATIDNNRPWTPYKDNHLIPAATFSKCMRDFDAQVPRGVDRLQQLRWRS